MPRFTALFAIWILAASSLAQGQTPVPQAPVLSAKTDVEDGHRMLVATLMDGSKPVANATITFSLKRSFGSMVLGQDTTLDDGTAAVALPSTLPTDPDGTYRVSLQVTAPAELAAVAGEYSLPGAPREAAAPPGDRRELWSRHAPIPLLISLAAILAAVWGTYAFVVRQLLLIKKGGSHA